MLSTLRSLNVFVGMLSHNVLRAVTLHPTELSINGAIPFVNMFMSTILLPHSTMLLLTPRGNGLIITFATLGPKNGTRSYGLILRFT